MPSILLSDSIYRWIIEGEDIDTTKYPLVKRWLKEREDQMEIDRQWKLNRNS